MDEKFVNYLIELKNNQVISLDNLKKLIFDALDYFLDKEKIRICYEKHVDSDSYYEDPVKCKSIIENIVEITNEETKIINDKYEPLIKKKIGILNATKNDKKKDTTNKEVNFVWQLSLLYSFGEEELQKRSMEEIFRNVTIEGLKLFGYDQYCREYLLKKND